MKMLLKALIQLTMEKKIYIKSSSKLFIFHKQISAIITALGKIDWQESITKVFDLITEEFGYKKGFKVLDKIFGEYGSELSKEESKAFEDRLKSMEKNLMDKGVKIDHPKYNISEPVDDASEKSARSSSKETMYLFDEQDIIDKYTYDNTSYSGSDIVATITVPGRGPVVIGELSSVSYSILREKTPVRALGHINMKGYARGARTITGMLVFTVFNETIVYKLMDEMRDYGYRMLMDEMPTFDITILAANEFGHKSTITIYGVTTYTEGFGISVADMITQTAYEFYALDVDPIQNVERTSNVF